LVRETASKPFENKNINCTFAALLRINASEDKSFQ